jgi:transcription elongation factor Elf1
MIIICISDNMEYKKCPECKSKSILITSDLNGKVYSVLCRECGFLYESEELKSLESEINDTINNFDRSDILLTKKGEDACHRKK